MDYGPDAEQVLALVLREAVTNVLRHSGARNCTVKLQETADGLLLQVSDDGEGGQISEGAGLRGMRERLQTLGGRLEVDSGSGLTLRARVPA